MIEQAVYFFLLSGLFITWFRPLYATLTQEPSKQWLEFWLSISTLTYLEFYVFPEYSRDLAYNFVRTLSLFVLSERAYVASSPKKKPVESKEDSLDDLPCENFAEKLIHFDKFNEKTSVRIIEKLMESSDESPFEFKTAVDWISKPTTLRSATVYKLAMILSGESFPEAQLASYSKSSVPEILIRMLKSSDLSDRDTSILAICYLVDRSKKCRKVFFELHVFDIVKPLMKSKTHPMCTRALVALCRRIYYERDQAKDEFIRGKMTVNLIEILESDVQELVGETAEAVKDLVMKNQSVLNKNVLQIMANQGLHSAVQVALKKHGSNNKMKIALRTIDTLIKSL